MRPPPRRTPAPRLAALLVALLATSACQTSPPPPPGQADGTISGSLSVVAAGSTVDAAGVPLARGAPLAPGPSPTAATGEVVPGEIIVRFVEGVRAASLTTLAVGDARLQAVRHLSLPQTALYRAAGADRAATLALVAALRARPDVVYAEPNLVLRPLRTPDDPFYPDQWHYPAIGLPAAWDVTTGAADIVVAVGDTGILHAGDGSPDTHPELVGRVLPGYDWGANAELAGDGDGRDPDPYDEGDDPHGTHVAGTIAASSDDGEGVAGVDWAAMLLPVRVLGVGGGGPLVDVIEGTLWAAGFAVAGVPPNPNPAHVINLSLGVDAPCSSFAQDAFDRIADASPNAAIVVVAAGNEGGDAGFSTPANCANVVVVGATDYLDERAWYSNHGPRIDVMAPGGDPTANLSGHGNDGVLSLGRNGTFGYALQSGTSMAAAHVAGVVALLKSLDPGLTRTEALALLTDTARPLTAAECGDGLTSADCGAGLIDAAAAVVGLAGGDIPTPGGGAIAYDPNPVDYGSTLVTRDIRLTNTGDASVGWSLSEYVEDPANPGAVPEGAVYFTTGSPTEGTLAPGASTTTTIGIDRAYVTAPGAYRIDLLFLVDGVEQPLAVRFQAEVETLDPNGPVRIETHPASDVAALAGQRTYPSFVASYSLATEPGRLTVVAWSDENGSGTIDAGDLLGQYPVPVDVAAGGSVTGIDITLAPVLDADEAGGAAAGGR